MKVNIDHLESVHNIKPAYSNYLINYNLGALLIAQTEDYAIFMLDPNGYVISWNKGAEKNTGYTSAEAAGLHISSFYPEEQRQANRPRADLNATLKNNTHRTEGWRVRKDGTLFWASTSLNTLYDEKEHLIGFGVVAQDVTDLRKIAEYHSRTLAEMEERLRTKDKRAISNERRFRKLIENSYDGLSLFDKDLQVFYRSRSAERIIGWTNVERSVKELESLVHPDDLEIVEQGLKETLANPDQPLLINYRAKHRLGHYVCLECLLTNKLADPDINAIVCNFRDVTERVNADEQIRDKNRQIESILESITDGFISLDKHFNYIYANHKIGEMVGRDVNTLIGKNVWDVYPEAINSDTYKALHTALQTQQYTWNEDYYEPLGLWQENHIYPTEDGLSVFIRDITERKLVEVSLLQSESNLRSVFENTDLSIVMFDTEAKVLSFNRNAAELSQRHFNKELKTGLSVFHYASVGRRSQVRTILNQVLDHSPISYEVSYNLPEQTVWYEVRWVSVTDDEQQHVGIILTLKNITEKKETELEREQITKDLMQRNKDLEQFTYIVSHNLRAPLANIQGLSGILIDEEEIEDKETLSALSTSVHKLDDVIHDLNDILQVGNAADDTLENIPLTDLVDEIALANKRLIEKHHATIATDFNDLPELKSLKGYLYSIFQNLIVNSIKFRRADADPIIEITGKRDENKACVYIKDNGKGIDMARQGEHLFGLYKRFDLAVEGKGMGLFMVKMQVERLGGKITAESTLNQGTEFKIEFPLKSGQA